MFTHLCRKSKQTVDHDTIFRRHKAEVLVRQQSRFTVDGDNALRSLLDAAAGAPAVVISGRRHHPDIGIADIESLASRYIGREIGRYVIVALDQVGFSVVQTRSKILQVLAGEGRANGNRDILGQRLGQPGRDIAHAGIEADDIAVRTVIGITELASGFAITANPEIDLEKRLVRSRLGRQVDHPAAKFARIVDRVTFLHNR